MKIKVCDSIMGSGKTSAVIAVMNAHPEKRYLYITPQLTETERMQKACPGLHFELPVATRKCRYSKQVYLQGMVEDGKNIAISHKLFVNCRKSTLERIKEKHYTVIIDEAVDVFEPVKMRSRDYALLRDANILKTSDNQSGCIDFDYEKYELGGNAGVFDDLSDKAKSRRLVQLDGANKDPAKRIYMWTIAKELFEVADDVYVLTYMFEHQMLRYYFDLNNIEYEYVYVCKDNNGNYSFTDTLQYIPEYIGNLSNMIHIFDNKKLNSIGDSRTALSSTWFGRLGKEKGDLLRRNVANYFKNYYGSFPFNLRLWSTYKSGVGRVRGKGYYNSNLAFNCKAVNDYSDRQILAYCVNIFLHPSIKTYFVQNGVDVNEDMYALSIMLQWIWRSAIRNGKEIWIYIPSRRMRTLLKEWITDTQQEYYKIYCKEVVAV